MGSPEAGSRGRGARTWPRRWAPSSVRWHRTRVGFWRAWLYTLRAVWATWRHRIFDLAAELPGPDDIVLARAPIAKFALIRSPEHARHVLLANQDDYIKGVEYDLLAVGFGRGLVTELDEDSECRSAISEQKPSSWASGAGWALAGPVRPATARRAPWPGYARGLRRPTPMHEVDWWRPMLGRAGMALLALTASVGLLVGIAPAAHGQDGQSDAENLARQGQRSAVYSGQQYQELLWQQSAQSFSAALAAAERDPERNFLTDLCWSGGLPCAGDVRLDDWGPQGDGLVAPVLFTNRVGATISGHVWATRAGPSRRPAIVITSGSLQASEEMYWWAAQALAKAGYVVITTDAQDQGLSDAYGEGSDALEGFPPQTAGNTFYDGTQDALDFLLSTPAHPFCPRPARSGQSHCAKQQRRVRSGLDTAYDPLWRIVDPSEVGLAGHSYGAQGVSYVGQQDRRVEATVAWDNLCDPTRVASSGALTTDCQSGFQPPAPTLHTPALGLSNDYLGGPIPHGSGQPEELSGASLALSKAGVDTGEIVIRGGTHFEYSFLPSPLFPATLRGIDLAAWYTVCLLYTSPSPRDRQKSRMPSSA